MHEAANVLTTLNKEGALKLLEKTIMEKFIHPDAVYVSVISYIEQGHALLVPSDQVSTVGCYLRRQLVLHPQKPEKIKMFFLLWCNVSWTLFKRSSVKWNGLPE